MSRKTAWSQFADSVGHDIAAELVMLWPGMEKRVPVEPTDGLVRHLGLCRARRLCRIAGGERLCVPQMTSEQVQRRNQRITADRARGVKMNEIAKANGLTVRHVRRIINNNPARTGSPEARK